MKNLFIHIGQPRTGTTTIQRFCKVNEHALAAQGLNYMLIGRDVFPANHKWLWFSFLTFLGGRPKNPPEEVPDLTTSLKALRQEIVETRNQNLLISFEGFSTIADWPRCSEALRMLSGYVDDICRIRIIYYCRKPLDMIKSSYRQRCHKVPAVGPFMDFVMSLGYSILDQSRPVEAFSEIVDPEDLIIRLYEADTGTSLIERFFDIWSIDITGLDVPGDANVSDADGDLETSRIMHNLQAVRSSDVKRLIYGRRQPSTEVWDDFVERLQLANDGNRLIFKQNFGLDLEGISLADLIWHERMINHGPMKAYYISDLSQYPY